IIAYESSITVINNQNAEDAQIIVPSKNEEINKVINLNEVNTDEKLLIDDETVILTDKLADLLKVNKGDIILLKNSDGIEVQVTIGAIAENYINHYVYMSKQMYNNLFGTYIDNSIYLNYKQASDEINNKVSKEIIELENVTGVAQTSYIRGLMNDMMSSLNYVVIILIVSSGLLAFVVLFNLANINISERIRELATIKVLGFYDKEVFDYLNRETIILTIIGTILGLFGGYFLTYYILGTCEINVLRFAKTVSIQSYIYSTLITISFTLIVNLFTYKALKKIDMIESLKSVE
ncbi:MAG: ABC transporter permease, partial [Candidatus Scatovivens sp.]